MAAFTSRAVHELIQQLDRAAVAANKEEIDDLENACQVALMIESLGIDNWVQLFHTFTTKCEETTLSAIRLLHEELTAMLENDVLEETRAEKLSTLIEDEKAAYSDCVDNFHATQAEDNSSRTDAGNPFVPTDTPRTVEYKVSSRNSMMWKIPNMNNLSPFSIEMWTRLANLSETEIKTRENNAIHGIMNSKHLAI
ncbi:hypothetical protein R1sor_015749 [Riccia sorocarpa]|uniref:Uncharacterized protein n=1 Tax=Riccia sorocarpa TaxID=122646 RepID=A0ABD3HGG7_9MARC